MTELKKYLMDISACKEAVEWVADRDIATAWADCSRGDWMLWLAGEANLDLKTLVLAACDCVEPVLMHAAEGEHRPKLAIETARVWTRGDATLYEVRAAAVYAASAAAACAACAAYAVYDAAYAAYAVYDAAYDASAAASQASRDARAARAESLAHSANLVRKRITAQMISDAIRAASRPGTMAAEFGA